MRRVTTGLFVLAFAVCIPQTASNDRLSQAYDALTKAPIWVHPDMAGRINQSESLKAVQSSNAFPIKLIVLPSLTSDWMSGQTERRGPYAKWLFVEKLKLDSGAVVVATKKGITSYSPSLPERRLVELNNAASKKGGPTNLTPSFVALAGSLRTEAAKVGTAKTSVQQARPAAQPAPTEGFNFAIIVCPAVAIAALAGLFVVSQRSRLAKSKLRAAGYRDRAVNSIAYLDSYADLLPIESDRQALQSARDRSNSEYESGLAVMGQAKSPADLDGANLHFERAAQIAREGRDVVLAATGGSGAAFAIAPDGYADTDDPRIYQPVKNVCFFCSRPSTGNLIPVTVNVEGQRQTVLVCPDDLAVVKSGQTPDLRGQTNRGRFVPWYAMSDYDPGRDYSSRASLFDTIAITSLVSNMSHNHSHAGWWSGGEHVQHGALHDATGGGTFEPGQGPFDSSDFGGGAFDSGSFSDGGGSFDGGGGDGGGGGD